jgi:pyrimidine deaminase RibD-like protein
MFYISTEPCSKQLVSQVLNQPCSPTMALAVAGFAKVFVGEIIEKGKLRTLGSTTEGSGELMNC